MSFLHPALLAAGLGAVLIPILIHILMRRRRQPVRWAAMRFLEQALKSQRRRLRLEQLLLLAARCLVLALLALALGRPLLGDLSALPASGPRTVYLVIDASIASSRPGSGAGTSGPTRLAEHQAQARELLSSLDASRGDKAALLALSGRGLWAEASIATPTSQIASVASAVAALTPTDAPADLHAAFERLSALLASPGDGAQPQIVYLGDLLAAQADVSRPLASLVPTTASASTPAPVLIVADSGEGTAATNVSLASVEPTRAVLVGKGASSGVRVTLARSGNLAGPGRTEVRAQLWTPAGPAGPESTASVTWAPAQREAQAVLDVASSSAAEATSGSESRLALRDTFVRVRIDADAIEGDNEAVRVLTARDRLDLALLASPSARGRPGASAIERLGPADWLELALAPVRSNAPDLKVTALDPARAFAGSAARSLAEFDAALVASPESLDDAGWARLAELLDRGGLVLLMPSTSAGAQLWTDRLAALGADWTLPRDPIDLSSTGGEGSGLALATTPPPTTNTTLLATLGPELAELARPVRVRRVLPIRATERGPAMLSLADGQPFVLASRGKGDRGLIVLLAAPPDLAWSDLPARPLMVPLMQELVRQGVGQASAPISLIAGAPMDLPAGARLRKLAWPGGEDAARASLEPESISPPALVRHRSLWQLVETGVAGERVRGLASVAPGAGLIDPVPGAQAWLARAFAAEPITARESLAQASRQARANASTGPGGSTETRAADTSTAPPGIAPWLLLAAALLAGVEMILARRFSHAETSARPGPGAGVGAA